MKKSSIVFLSFIFIFFSIYFFTRKDQTKRKIEDTTISLEKTSLKTMTKNFPLKHSPRKPAQAKKPVVKEETFVDKLSSFSREKISWVNENIFYLPDLKAVKKKDPLIRPVSEENGFFFYESFTTDGDQVVFNSDKNRYGVYSKEITVKGDLQVVSEFAQSKSWKVLYQNEKLKTSILQVPQLEDTALIQELSENPKIRWTLGIIYARPTPK